MKKQLLILSCISLAGFGFITMPNVHIAYKNGPVIQFDYMVHDFGTLKEGDIVNYVFRFTNKGTEPLIIKDVEQPCGCTIPSWSKAPVMPGQSGEIKVIFNSKERPGIFRKTLEVKTNMAAKPGEPLMLMIKGNVLTKKQWKMSGTATNK